MSEYWWDRTSRSPIGGLDAVVVSLDRALTAGDCPFVRELVWDLHCAGIRVAAVTALRGDAVHRSVRDLLGDGAVELVLTGDDANSPRPDPETYHLALWELGVRAEHALAVEDSDHGLRAAGDAGLAAVMMEESLSVYRCRRVWERSMTGVLSVLFAPTRR